MTPSSGKLPVPAAPASSSGAVAAVDAEAEAPPSSGVGETGVVVALRRYLGSRAYGEGRDFVRAVVIRKLYGRKPKGIDEELVDELTQAALLEAMEAKEPPWFVRAIPNWVARVTRRTIAKVFRGALGDKKNLDRDADAQEWSDRHEPATDWGAREHLIVKYLEEHVIQGDPYKRDTFRVMMESRVGGKTLDEMAAERGTTANALSTRIHRLEKKLVPAVSVMDREKPRMTVIVLLFLSGLVAAVSLLFWLLGIFSPAPPRAVPQPSPVVSAPSAPPAPAPPPEFDNAQPTGPAPATPPSDGKPKLKP